MATKFWGLVADGGRRYQQKADRGFFITMATLEPAGFGTSNPSNPRYDDIPIHVMLDYNNTTYILCTLWYKEHIIQAPLNLSFGIGEVLTFYLQGGSGKNKVHLTGFYSDSAPAIPITPSNSTVSERQSILVSSDSKSKDKTKKRVSIQEEVNVKRFENDEEEEDDTEDEDIDYDEDDTDDDEDADEEGLLRLMNGKLGDVGEMDDDDDDDDDSDEDEFEMDDDDSDETNEQPSPKEKKNGDIVREKVKQKNSDSKKPVKLSSSVDSEDDDTSEEEDNDSSIIKEEAMKTPPKNKKLEALKTPENKKSKKNKEMVTPENQNIQAKSPSSAGHTPMKFVSKGGLMIHELKVGNGPQAKQGKMVTVYYSGRLKSNNRQFDASTSGPGFKFRLGKGEVIKGWDLGLDGMKVGGKRRIIIPSHMAYGKKGAPPDIPPNSTLVFEIELKNVS